MAGLAKVIPISTALFGCGLILFSLSRFFWLSAGLQTATQLTTPKE